MAIVYPSSNIAALIDKLKELKVESGVVVDLNKLQTISNKIGALVRDAEKMEIYDESTKHWLDELGEIASESQHLVDELEYEITRAQAQKQQADDNDDVQNAYVHDDDDDNHDDDDVQDYDDDDGYHDDEFSAKGCILIGKCSSLHSFFGDRVKRIKKRRAHAEKQQADVDLTAMIAHRVEKINENFVEIASESQHLVDEFEYETTRAQVKKQPADLNLVHHHKLKLRWSSKSSFLSSLFGHLVKRTIKRRAQTEIEIVKAQVTKQKADFNHVQQDGDDEDDSNLRDDDDSSIKEESQPNLSTFLATITADRLQKINERFDEIWKYRKHLRLTPEDGARRPGYRPKYPLSTTHMLSTSHEVYGREDDKRMIVDWLIGKCSRNNVSVISIVGKGGIGKTTVAQLVYNDPEVSAFFDLKIWISVYLEFDIVKLTKEMVEAASGGSYSSSQLSVLQNLLQTQLAGKNVLLVLDDVWTVQRSFWESFKSPLDNGEQAVRIIVTTRNDEISSIINGTKLHRLDYLPNNECWELFKSQAFYSETSRRFAHSEDIGRRILRKCGGLPLVVKSLGGILRYSTDEDRWNDVLESKLWELEEDNEILPILQLSYNCLPNYLKPCFLSCAVFPRDFKLKKVEVVYLWIALGYIQTSKSRSLEDIGNDYFDILQNRSFFDIGNIHETTFKMHDCIHDLAQHISNKSSSISFKLRALVSNSSKNDLSTSLTANIKHLRFVIINEWPKDLHYLYNLRVLIVEKFTSKLPNEIVNLINLMYLRVPLETLTRSICQLYNLVTLDLSSSKHDSLWYKQCFLPTDFGKLSKLERLYLYALTDANGINELNNLINLRETLCVENIKCINDEGAKKANLKNKPKLEHLILYWNDSKRSCCNLSYKHLHLKVCDNYHHSSTNEKGEDLLESLQPHTNLRSLKIEDYDGVKFPIWVGDPSYTRLTKIQLIGCKEAGCLPTLGLLPLLEYLKIWGFSNVKSIGREFLRNLTCDNGLNEDEKVAFPSLLKLKFYEMPRWELWHRLQDHDFPLLQELHVGYSQSIIRLPGFLLEKMISFESSIKAVGEIKFLKNLKTFGRGLHISGLRNISNAEDVEDANMKTKNQLDSLTLDFGKPVELRSYQRRLCLDVYSHYSNYNTVEEVENIQAAVLESLQPHANLSILHIYRYGGVVFPHWIGDPSFTNLTHITISKCANMNNIKLPKLGQLPCLRDIRIQKILHIKKIGPEFGRSVSGLNDNDIAFPSLRMLVFRDMPKLEEWTGVLHGDFPRLKTLVIVNCPSLTTVPTVPPSVLYLQLWECGSLNSPHLEPELYKTPSVDWDA